MQSERQAEARALRLDGASFPAIGAILGVSKQRAFQLVNRSEARQRQREQRQRRAERQRALVADLHAILIAGGAVTVSAWADALNLSRSTAHSLFAVQRKHGITRTTLKRMLASPQLPPQARARLTSWQISASTSEKPLAPIKPDSMKPYQQPYGVDATRLRPPATPRGAFAPRGWGMSAARV
jgi:hypothetical protein